MDLVVSMLKKKFPQYSGKIDTALNIYNRVKSSPDTKKELEKIGINNNIIKSAKSLFNQNTSNPLLKGIMTYLGRSDGINEVNSILDNMSSNNLDSSNNKEDLSKFYDGLKNIK